MNDDPEMCRRANLAVCELTDDEYNSVFTWDLEKYP